MSLNEITQNLAGHDQPDVASLDFGGIHYRCYVWLNKAQYTVDAAVFEVQHDETEVLLFANHVAVTTPTEQTNTAGYPLDCPKVIASGQHFVVHWLQCDDVTEGGEFDGVRNWELYRATMDMEAFDVSNAFGWTNHGSIALDPEYLLYDVAPVEGAAVEPTLGGVPFVVARTVDPGTIRVLRATCDNFGWPFTDWAVDITRDHRPRVLSVCAHEEDNDVVVAYQRSPDDGVTHGLYCAHLDADDGGGFVDVWTFDEWEDGGSGNDGEFLQVGLHRAEPNVVVVVAEAVAQALLDDVATYGNSHNIIHHVLYRAINGTTADRLGFEFSCANLYMVSRPWSYASASARRNVYCVFAFKSAYDTNDWEQASIFAANLDFGVWAHSDIEEISATQGSNLRPRPIANFVHTGVPDARPSIGGPELASALYSESGLHKRGNHLSSVAGAPPFGPGVKTRTVAVGVWARLGSQRANDADGVDVAELQPENLGVSGFVVYMEDPWTVFRDDSDPTQPIDNFKGPYPRSMGQAIGAGRALFFSGGVPSLYDGRQIVECGFPWKPEPIHLVGSDLLEGEMTNDSTFQYYYCFTQRDNSGQMHRSGPSRVVEAAVGTLGNSTTARVRTLTVSQRDASFFYPHAENSVQIEVFRTPASDHADYPKFYRVFGATRTTGTAANGGFMRVRDTPVNDPRAQYGYVEILDTVSDANLILQGLGPYQYGADAAAGLVGPIPQTTPALTCCSSWLNRIFGADAIDPTVIWYTDEIFPDYGSDYALAPFFSTELTYRIGEIGEITAMQAMNNALVVFTARDIYILTAIDAGGGLLQINSELLHVGTGCIEPKSVVLGEEGIYFQASKGYHLLDRGRGLQYLPAGADVEDEIRASGNVRGASMLEDRTQLRVVCNGRPVTTWTTTFTITNADGNPGEYHIGLPSYGEIAFYDAGGAVANSTVASALQSDIFDLIDDGSISHLIVDATLVSNTVVVTWAPDVVPDYTESQPAGASLVGVDESELTTYPRVLILDTLRRMWSRAELVQTSTETRMSELVGGCIWRLTSGENAHVALAQGALLVERASDDEHAYEDQTSTGFVPVSIDVKTRWLHFAGVAGYQRVRSIGVQTQKPNASEYHIDIDYTVSGDYDDYETEEAIYVASPSPAYTRIRPSVQKVSAQRIRVYEATGSSENIKLVALVFEVGVKPGPRRVASTQTGT